jgi:uncharacterized membrane protein
MNLPTASALPQNTSRSARIQSIDFLRGIVMVFMALDHARTFFHSSYVEFNAEDLTQTNPALFFTRWITHFCAPVFIFLTGVSAYLMLQKIKSKKKVFNFLLTRGLLLLLLELTLFRYCWHPRDPFFQPFILVVVIWAIGWSMIFLAFMIWLPYRIILGLGLAILIFHNTLAGISFPGNSAMDIFWAFFYRGGMVEIPGNVLVLFLYPILPHIGLIALGYCLGYIYGPAFTSQRRKKTLYMMGSIAIILFLLLRYFNLYGDPHDWETQHNTIYSIMAFLRTTKYPLSLLYALMTIGPALIVLALLESVKGRIANFFVVIGSVPMFYFILHLFLLVVLAFIIGFNKYNLVVTYALFVLVVICLYFLCRWYSRYKFEHPEKKWLKYI